MNFWIIKMSRYIFGIKTFNILKSLDQSQYSSFQRMKSSLQIVRERASHLKKKQLLLIIRIMIWHWKYGTNINVLNAVNVIRTHISYLKFWHWWHFNVLTFIFNYFNDFKKQIFLILSPQYNKSKDIL